MNKFFLVSALTGGVSLAAVVMLGVQVNDLQQRLVVMESTVGSEGVQPTAAQNKHAVLATQKSLRAQRDLGETTADNAALLDQEGTPVEDGPLDLVENPELRQQVEELISQRQDRVWKEKMQEYSDARKAFVEEHVWEFVSENQLGNEKAHAILGIFADMTKARKQLGEDVEAGELTRAESWMEHRAMREEADEALAQLLGEDVAQDLQETIRGGFHGGR